MEVSPMEDYSFDIVEVSPCRICSSVEGAMNIFTAELQDEGVLLHEALEFITCLKVDPEDGLGQSLCPSCIERLLNAYQFKNQALNVFFDQNSISIHRKSIEVDDNDMGDENKSENLEIDTFPPIDMSTDAATFLIEHHQKSCKEAQIHKELNDIDVDWVSTSRRPTHSKRNTSKQYECKVCDKPFRKKSNLVDHLRLHANLKKFACSYCDKSFVQVGNYRTHLRIHTKERPFQCTLCGKTYTQSSTLKVHIRSHTQERNFTCLVCGRGFTSSSDLCKHKKVHDISLQYKCEFCDKCFAQKVNLQTHIKRHHANSNSN